MLQMALHRYSSRRRSQVRRAQRVCFRRGTPPPPRRLWMRTLDDVKYRADAPGRPHARPARAEERFAVRVCRACYRCDQEHGHPRSAPVPTRIRIRTQGARRCAPLPVGGLGRRTRVGRRRTRWRWFATARWSAEGQPCVRRDVLRLAELRHRRDPERHSPSTCAAAQRRARRSDSDGRRADGRGLSAAARLVAAEHGAAARRCTARVTLS